MYHYRSRRQIIFRLVENLAVMLAILSIGVYASYSICEEAFTNYLLKNYGERTLGYITDINEDVSEKESGGVRYTYYYGYEFKVGNKTIEGGGNHDGDISELKEHIESEPLEVDIMYMKRNPSISRVDFALQYDATYIFRRILATLVALAITVYLVYLSGKHALKQYKTDVG